MVSTWQLQRPALWPAVRRQAPVAINVGAMSQSTARGAGAAHPVSPAVVAAFRAGDRAAFITVYDALSAQVRPVIARFFPSSFERDEAVQEVWMHVLGVARSFDPARGELLPWLRSVAANRCRELLRARGRRVQPDAELEPDLVADGDAPDTHASRARARAALERFAGRLTGPEARVFKLSILDERSHDEVAAALGISPRRCKYLRLKVLRRALADSGLRQALEELGGP